MMRHALFAALLWCIAVPVQADGVANRLFDAMGLPGLISAFAEDGRQSMQAIDRNFLGGDGGDVFYETARRLYDPARMEAELRTSFAAQVDPADAEQALVFFDSAQGQDIVRLEVEARAAIVDESVEAAVRAQASNANDAVLRLLEVRDLVAVNTDIAVAARLAFFDGLLAAAPGMDVPDVDGQRAAIEDETRAWITGYYMLVGSALEANALDTYAAFWETDVGQGVDAALSTAFEESYVALSYGLGQVVGRLLPQNDL
ncbi:hypothetical protein [Tateyamaria sp. SN6-1]|uniref:hypothetical protein n=1 Tax=Tateyamaria sp. SN6-1 TaxID=3092148 RepID=UPI0039F57C53